MEKEDYFYRDIYRSLCESEKGRDIPLFAQSWWLDIVCPNSWTALLYPEQQQHQKQQPKEYLCDLKAAMPIYAPCHNTVQMPFFTQTTGIWISKSAPIASNASPDTKPKNDYSEREKALRFFADKLAPKKYVNLNLPLDAGVCLPFYWKGFALHTRYTFRLTNLTEHYRGGDLHAFLISSMNQNCLKHVKQAVSKGVEVKKCNIDEFIDVYKETFIKQSIKKNNEEINKLKDIIKSTLEKEQGLLLGGYDSKGLLISASFVVWQGETAFYIAGGSKKGNFIQTQNLVMLHSIEHIASFCDTFDFEGSMLEGVATFFSRFGSKAYPYIQITNKSAPLALRAFRKLNRTLTALWTR